MTATDTPLVVVGDRFSACGTAGTPFTITVEHLNGESFDYETGYMPWVWRTFLVIRALDGRMTYTPLENVKHWFRPDEAASN